MIVLKNNSVYMITIIFGIVLILNIFMALDYVRLNNQNKELINNNELLFDQRNEYYESNKNVIAKYNVNVKEQCTLYNAYDNIYKENIANGLYWNDADFYCVWAKNKSLSTIEKTDRHEYAHYLVDNDYEHFCMNDHVINRFDIIKNRDTK